jgi:hypothetical protein
MLSQWDHSNIFLAGDKIALNSQTYSQNSTYLRLWSKLSAVEIKGNIIKIINLKGEEIKKDMHNDKDNME